MMGTDELLKKRQGKLRKRKEAIKELEPLRILIVCEGEKTEPNYFKELKNKINAKHRKDFVKLNVERIEVIGSGKNTESLIEHAIAIRNRASIGYGSVWCVFDKDDFSEKQFNNAINKAKSKGIKVAWSNESIELWFLLHFQFIASGINRRQYIQNLSKYFSDNKISKGKYIKNNIDIYNILEKYGSYQFALINAKKLEESNVGKTPSESKPMTTVYKLVEELKELLK